MMKVLFVFDMAGVCSIISHYYKNSDLIFHDKGDLTSGIAHFYNSIGFKRFRYTLFNAIIKSKNYDIVHISSVDWLVPLFKILGKKVVLHYHGSDIIDEKQDLFHQMFHIFCRNCSDLILYNRHEMNNRLHTIRKSRYFENIIDTNLFKKTKNPTKYSLAIVSENVGKKEVCDIIQKLDKNCEIIDIDKTKRKYEDMPDFLGGYARYYDIKIKYGNQLNALSTTGLQALSMGLEVYWKNQIIKGLPEEHRPEQVIKKLINSYKMIIHKKVLRLYKHGNLKIMEINGKYLAFLKEDRKETMYQLEDEIQYSREVKE